MLVKELVWSYDKDVANSIGVRFLSGTDEILYTENYAMIAPLFDNLSVKSWSFDWDSQSIEIALLYWDPRDFERKTKPYVFVGDEPTEETKRRMGISESEEKVGKGMDSIRTQMPSNFDNLDIRNLNLRKEVLNPLNGAGILSIGELREFTAKELMELKRIGKGAIEEIQDALYPYNLHLKEE